MLSFPISSIISTVEPSSVARSKHPFIKNFMLPVPDASCPAVLHKIMHITWEILHISDKVKSNGQPIRKWKITRKRKRLWTKGPTQSSTFYHAIQPLLHYKKKIKQKQTSNLENGSEKWKKHSWLLSSRKSVSALTQLEESIPYVTWNII